MTQDPSLSQFTDELRTFLGKIELYIADLLTLGIILFLVFRLYQEFPWMPDVSGLAFIPGVVVTAALLGLTIIAYLVAFKMYRLYEAKFLTSSLDDFPRVVNAVTIYVMILLVIGSVLAREQLKLELFALIWIGCVTMTPLNRSMVKWLEERMNGRGVFHQNALIFGTGEVGLLVANKLKRHPEARLNIVGFVDESPPANSTRLGGLKFLGDESKLLDIIKKYNIRHIIIAFSTASHEKLLKLIRQCDSCNVEFSIVPRLFEIITAQSDLKEIEGVPLVCLRKVKLTRLQWLIKRSIDVIVSGLLLLILVPIFLLIALVIRIDSPGPAFFRQERVGKYGRRFVIYKFRSMVNGAEETQAELHHLNEATGPLFKIRDDPRLTRVGRWLRVFSIDELPQLINVLKGDMSLVGPRPPLPSEVERYKDWEKKRLNVTPGITGLWQVTGRSDLPFDEMVKLDYLYIQNWSVWLDLKLLLQTIPIVLKRRGAY
jgi:exopolysaccharide biosynthesis polyprenyl glycosylphosphotransferase